MYLVSDLSLSVFAMKIMDQKQEELIAQK